MGGMGYARAYGAFHSGVEVYGREWSFGLTECDGSGITWCTPGQHPDHHFRETLAMGCTRLSAREVVQVIKEMELEWTGRSYRLLTRNCHNFSDAFCERLGVSSMPSWVNDLAGAGAVTVDAADGLYNGVAKGASVAYDGAAYVASGVYSGVTVGASAAYGGVARLNCCSSSSRKLTAGGAQAPEPYPSREGDEHQQLGINTLEGCHRSVFGEGRLRATNPQDARGLPAPGRPSV